MNKIRKNFNTWEDNNKIYITSNYNKKFIITFKEKYTGLSIYKTETHFQPGVEYWYQIGPRFDIINGILIEIYDQETLVYKESYEFGENIKLQLEEELHYDKNDINSWAPFFEVFIKNSYESELVKFEKDDIVVDFGANIGMFALFASKKSKKIYSVEPLPETYINLQKNTQHLNNVTILNKAVYSKGGNIEFNKNKVSGASSIFNQQDNFETVTIETITFDDFVKQYNLDRINYLKVDIEGAEFDLFENMDENYLQNNIDKIFMEVHIMDNFKLEDILNKIGKYFIYNIEEEGIDANGVKLYTISCLNKNINPNIINNDKDE
jgi:FkbM family methyltransferase